MIATTPPADPSHQLQWLVDRAQISDLLIELARALDDGDADAYARVYAEDGLVELPGGVRLEGRELLPETVRRTLGGYDAVWHMSANHAIEIDGDHARTRSYMLAVHRHGQDLSHHATGAGWYENTLRRTSAGWRFTLVRLRLIWRSGTGPLPGETSDTQRPTSGGSRGVVG